MAERLEGEGYTSTMEGYCSLYALVASKSWHDAMMITLMVSFPAEMQRTPKAY